MIIDAHCHYPTEPAALHQFRDRQLAGLADAARRPATTDLGIGDDALIKSVAPQLKLQAERGSTLTILSPRAAGMGKIFEGNVRRVYPRLDRLLAQRGVAA